MNIPAQFIFTDVAAANAEVARLYRAVGLSGEAILQLLHSVSDEDFPAAKRIADALCERLDAISDERPVR
jgi:hypothetical protein